MSPCVQSNTVWAFATLETEPRRRLMAGVAHAMAERVADCNPQEISNTCWAFAKLRKLLCQPALVLESVQQLQSCDALLST